MKRNFCLRSKRGAGAIALVALLGGALMSEPAWAVLDYSSSLATEFKATFPGGDPGAGAPVGNPFGDWALLGPGGSPSELIAVAGGLPASGQPGWCEGSAGACTTPAPYTYFGTAWQPGITIDPRVVGHANMSALWTAPANIDEGGVSITGSIEQLFEPTRVLRLSVYKNGSASPSYFIDSQPPTVNGVILNRVDFGPAEIAVSPGDTLNFVVDGSGEGGEGIPTFAAWDVTLTEARVVPEPATVCMLILATMLLGGNRSLQRAGGC